MLTEALHRVAVTSTAEAVAAVARHSHDVHSEQIETR
jgi:hypothetical protein